MPTSLKIITWIAAIAIFIGFLCAADHLYAIHFNLKTEARSAFLLKVADTLINAAIVGVLLAMLRWWFEIPKMVAALERLVLLNAPTTDPEAEIKSKP